MKWMLWPSFTHHRTLEQYLRALGRRFGADVTPEPA